MTSGVLAQAGLSLPSSFFDVTQRLLPMRAAGARLLGMAQRHTDRVDAVAAVLGAHLLASRGVHCSRLNAEQVKDMPQLVALLHRAAGVAQHDQEDLGGVPMGELPWADLQLAQAALEWATLILGEHGHVAVRRVARDLMQGASDRSLAQCMLMVTLAEEVTAGNGHSAY
jgi:hypothetical protein